MSVRAIESRILGVETSEELQHGQLVLLYEGEAPLRHISSVDGLLFQIKDPSIKDTVWVRSGFSVGKIFAGTENITPFGSDVLHVSSGKFYQPVKLEPIRIHKTPLLRVSPHPTGALYIEDETGAYLMTKPRNKHLWGKTLVKAKGVHRLPNATGNVWNPFDETYLVDEGVVGRRGDDFYRNSTLIWNHRAGESLSYNGWRPFGVGIAFPHNAVIAYHSFLHREKDEVLVRNFNPDTVQWTTARKSHIVIHRKEERTISVGHYVKMPDKTYKTIFVEIPFEFQEGRNIWFDEHPWGCLIIESNKDGNVRYFGLVIK